MVLARGHPTRHLAMTWRWQWKSLACVVADLLVTWAAASPPLLWSLPSLLLPPRCWAGHTQLLGFRNQPLPLAIGVRWGERQTCIRPCEPRFPSFFPRGGCCEEPQSSPEVHGSSWLVTLLQFLQACPPLAPPTPELDPVPTTNSLALPVQSGSASVMER